MADPEWGKPLEDVSSSAQSARRLRTQVDEVRTFLQSRPALPGVESFDMVMALLADELSSLSTALASEQASGAEDVVEMLIQKVVQLRSSLSTQGGNLSDLSTASETVENLLGRLRALQAAARG